MNDALTHSFDPSLDPNDQTERMERMGLSAEDLDPVAEEMASLGLPATVDTDLYLQARHQVVTGRLSSARFRATVLRRQRELDRRNRVLDRLGEASW